ncbi:unnamed protein product [Mycena citricolor]|uniref:Glycosyl transferase CAP10 domain-containing protein n=1 Tax=Mycena citricolor TaxID=2018698 RepID=A0AAD2H204_9AGAR|nr:unnamed protein product [Mycena citricolor]
MSRQNDPFVTSSQLRRRLLFCTLFATFALVLVGSHVYYPDALSSDPSTETWVLELELDDPTDAGNGTTSKVDLSDPEILAAMRVDELFRKQSQTVAEAATKYSMRYNRSPPPNFDRWFAYAQENRCLIDDYRQIQRDLEPFYQLAREDPDHFRRMADLGSRLLRVDPKGMVAIRIVDGQVRLPDYAGTPYDGEWQRGMSNIQFSSVLPDMEFLINGRDEPRVVFNTADPNNRKAALMISDSQPFRITPLPTADFFKDRRECAVIDTDQGFGIDALDAVPFIRSSSTSEFTTDLYPLLSMTKLASPCFADIVFPAQWYYASSPWSGKFQHADDIPWQAKKDVLYWRGMSNNGQILHQNYHAFTRFRLVKLAATRPDIMDAKMTGWFPGHCTTDCDPEPIIQEYITPGGAHPREEVYKYKFALDVDGHTFSGRFLGLLRSGSLVFKATAFTEYFSDWLRPYEHYIPVRIDLADLVEKVEWAIAHEEQARQIQLNGLHFAERVMTDRQNDCYLAAALLEWARLQSGRT